MKKKVLVAMSGGVDSSVAAYLLKQQGYEVVGVTMCLGIADTEDASHTKCCGVRAIDDAKEVCRFLDVPHYVLDFSGEMKEYIINDFVSEYLNGRTPNPCVRCNEYLKFGKLFDYAKTMGFDYFATGHYARIEETAGEFYLLRGRDRKKDQTYFLYGIAREKLSSLLFPLGEYTKDGVRKVAENAQLKVAQKPQSQDICFIARGGYKEFIAGYVKEGCRVQGHGWRGPGMEPGEIVTREGKVIGTHPGIIHYTLGQREGLGVAVGRPLYVSRLDARKNQVVVGDKEDLYTNTVEIDEIHLLVDEVPENVAAQIRYAHIPASCQCMLKDSRGHVRFKEPQAAVTPGQSLVFYSGDRVCGGGIIRASYQERS
ncbi:MAG: tRNA 2-thiouridine(34) synthase MnmA [Candidatus Omnitrophica bacterium]|nr:tRNA 2-thiouridine(34) synthase MnmA [Candidatus Omnitrophota bacterium]